ncbi:hypothetical protein [Streptomyces aureus]|uniref:Transposase n=1 Tax=Streptomyces aureus TaxID=193461 RepID=A0ABV4SKK2_9ACTN
MAGHQRPRLRGDVDEIRAVLRQLALHALKGGEELCGLGWRVRVLLLSLHHLSALLRTRHGWTALRPT